jgi:hypothetical protein
MRADMVTPRTPPMHTVKAFTNVPSKIRQNETALVSIAPPPAVSLPSYRITREPMGAMLTLA